VGAVERGREDVRQAREQWRTAREGWACERLVFLDETGLNTKMGRLYGRSAAGTRCPGILPHGHWRTSTFIAALRHDSISAPLLIDGPMDGAMFLAYIEQMLCAQLRPGELVICDNLSCHKVRGVARAIAATGAQLLYLPAYSPDLNPIEMAFSKLKAHLRKAAARNIKELIAATAAALDTFSTLQCNNFFRHAQYATN
jgi:transposase